jgi:hypothetical protein
MSNCPSTSHLPHTRTFIRHNLQQRPSRARPVIRCVELLARSGEELRREGRRERGEEGWVAKEADVWGGEGGEVCGLDGGEEVALGEGAGWGACVSSVVGR